MPTEHDIYLFHHGELFESYKTFGAHVKTEDKVSGVRFTVWAPNAIKVCVVGDFNNWNGDKYELMKINNEGIWSEFFSDVEVGDIYKYEIHTIDGRIIKKADPFAFYSEVRPNTASVVYNLSGYNWHDRAYKETKKNRNLYKNPLNIYEVHLGTWKQKQDGDFLSYRELAAELIDYVKMNGYTHIELMPIYEHPYDRSWGYQGTGYFSVTSRYGTPHDFMYLIDKCHQHGIGVILDWVPGHFCKDEHGLFEFDGATAFEYENPHVRQNDIWGTANFDLGKKEVQSFLISNALFWMDVFHIDGFRVDAVANMLYWKMHGGEDIYQNEYAVKFLQKLNEMVFEKDANMLMIAEDSTDWPMVTSPVSEGGLGFNYKWNMGWMNDVLKYMELHPHDRKHHQHLLTFSILYTYSENFILPFSHDEVVHGKKSLLNKMPGDYWQKFAQLRLLLGFMVGHPGKKLLFMGSEFGQFDEWKDLEDLDWELLNYGMHQQMHEYTRTLFNFYQETSPLWELDHSDQGFKWIDPNNNHQSILSFIRIDDQGRYVIFVCNFSPSTYDEFLIGVPDSGEYVEAFTSDAEVFGGSGQINPVPIKAAKRTWHNQPYCLSVKVPPYAVSIFRPIIEEEE